MFSVLNAGEWVQVNYQVQNLQYKQHVWCKSPLHFSELDDCESWISALILTICFACLWMFNFSYLHNNVFQVGKPEGDQEAGWGWCPADGDYPQS